MKRIRCPKCSDFITFDDTQYAPDQALGFTCPHCGKKFAIRPKTKATPTSNLTNEQSDEKAELPAFGHIVVIENVFHYKQLIPLHMGANLIGRYQKGVEVHCPIRTDDPSMDMTHCKITVSRNKNGKIKYVLQDGPSNTGTFVDNEILGDREQRIISDGTLFTIGATSIILRSDNIEEDDKP